MENIKNETYYAGEEPNIVPVEKEEKKNKDVSLKLVNCSLLNVRKSPTVESEIVGILDEKAIVKGHKVNKDWCAVVTPDGLPGYCMVKFLEPAN